MSRILWTVACVLSLLLAPSAAISAETHDQRVARANNGTVTIISGGIGGTYIRIATDLAAVLDERDEIRILPVAGKGSLQNIRDILYLKGIDIGIVQSDVLAYIKREGLQPGIVNRMRYVAKLYNEEFHLLVRDGTTDIQQLAGQQVNFGGEGSGTHITASIVFDGLQYQCPADQLRPGPGARQAEERRNRRDGLRHGQAGTAVFRPHQAGRTAANCRALHRGAAAVLSAFELLG